MLEDRLLDALLKVAVEDGLDRRDCCSGELRDRVVGVGGVGLFDPGGRVVLRAAAVGPEVEAGAHAFLDQVGAPRSAGVGIGGIAGHDLGGVGEIPAGLVVGLFRERQRHAVSGLAQAGIAEAAIDRLAVEVCGRRADGAGIPGDQPLIRAAQAEIAAGDQARCRPEIILAEARNLRQVEVDAVGRVWLAVGGEGEGIDARRLGDHVLDLLELFLGLGLQLRDGVGPEQVDEVLDRRLCRLGLEREERVELRLQVADERRDQPVGRILELLLQLGAQSAGRPVDDVQVARQRGICGVRRHRQHCVEQGGDRGEQAIDGWEAVDDGFHGVVRHARDQRVDRRAVRKCAEARQLAEHRQHVVQRDAVQQAFDRRDGRVDVVRHSCVHERRQRADQALELCRGIRGNVVQRLLRGLFRCVGLAVHQGLEGCVGVGGRLGLQGREAGLGIGIEVDDELIECPGAIRLASRSEGLQPHDGVLLDPRDLRLHGIGGLLQGRLRVFVGREDRRTRVDRQRQRVAARGIEGRRLRVGVGELDVVPVLHRRVAQRRILDGVDLDPDRRRGDLDVLDRGLDR